MARKKDSTDGRETLSPHEQASESRMHDQLGFGIAFNLMEGDLRSLREVADYGREGVAAIKGIGPASMRKIDAALKKQKLAWATPDPGEVPERCPLTQRELEALRHLSEGMACKQIASELFLSTSTVRSRLHSIYSKLGVVDRAQAVIIAWERGWLDGQRRYAAERSARVQRILEEREDREPPTDSERQRAKARGLVWALENLNIQPKPEGNYSIEIYEGAES